MTVVPTLIVTTGGEKTNEPLLSVVMLTTMVVGLGFGVGVGCGLGVGVGGAGFGVGGIGEGVGVAVGACVGVSPTVGVVEFATSVGVLAGCAFV